MQKILITKKNIDGCKECEYIKWAIKRIIELLCNDDIEIIFDEETDNALMESPVFNIVVDDKEIKFTGLPDDEDIKNKCYEKYNNGCGKAYFKYMDYKILLLEGYFLYQLYQIYNNDVVKEELERINTILSEVLQ